MTNQRQLEAFFVTQHPQRIGAGSMSAEGSVAFTISIAIETTQGMMLLCDTVDTECCYQDIQWNKPKSHAYTQEKKY